MDTQPASTFNGVFCKVCKTVIESTHRHDFKWCRCPAEGTTSVAVDGGPDYHRRAFGKDADYVELRSKEEGEACLKASLSPTEQP